MLNRWQAGLKRSLDVLFSAAVLVGTSPVLVLAVAAASVDTRAWGVFSQERVGRYGQRFRIYKVRTMRVMPGTQTSVTTAQDPRITPLGRFLRRTKIDELPQFVNVLVGQMSVVGPRPDVPGYADALQGEDRAVLAVRPGITGPASVFFRDEEALLAAQEDPERFNREVLWPAKVRINRDYVARYRFIEDLRLILDTVWPRLALSRAVRARGGVDGDGVFPRDVMRNFGPGPFARDT